MTRTEFLSARSKADGMNISRLRCLPRVHTSFRSNLMDYILVISSLKISHVIRFKLNEGEKNSENGFHFVQTFTLIEFYMNKHKYFRNKQVLMKRSYYFTPSNYF